MGMYTPTSMDSQVCNYCSYRQNNMSEVLSEDVRSRIYTLFLLENTFKKNFMAPFYVWGSTASRLEPLPGGSLLFTTKFPDIPGTHFTDLEG